MDILSRPWVQWMIGGVAGLALGLLVGWVIWPVKYVGEAYTYELNAAEKAEYVAAAADAYGLTRDGEAARRRFEAWTVEEKTSALAQVHVEDEARGDQAAAQRVTDLAMELGVTNLSSSTQNLSPSLLPERGGGEATGPVALSIVALVVLVVGLIGIGVAVALVRRRHLGDEANPMPKASRVKWTGEEWAAGASPTREENPIGGEAEGPVQANGERPALLPLKQWTSTYRGMGDFDESFNIETHDGAFVGECGMGRLSGVCAEKASEFEVWLFNKIETRNVSQVLVSDISRASGGNLAAAPGLEFTMQSGLLRVEVIVAEAEIVDGYFKTLSVTMTARME